MNTASKCELETVDDRIILNKKTVNVNSTYQIKHFNRTVSQQKHNKIVHLMLQVLLSSRCLSVSERN